jgi:four helix bundle protein
MDDLKDRTKQFAIRVIKLCSSLPKTAEYVVIGKQLIRSASSVGANYRSACRGKSRADFIAKLSVVEEEADESIYWMELLEALRQTPNTELASLKDEANQLLIPA